MLNLYINTYNDADRKLAVNSMLTQLLLYLKYCMLKKFVPQKSANPILSKAIEYINDNVDAVKGPSAVAKKLFISNSYLYMLFKKYLNTTPKNYINEKKMLKAEEYINSGMQLNYVYREIGFEDYSSFYRAFKKYFGHVPSSPQQGEIHQKT